MLLLSSSLLLSCLLFLPITLADDVRLRVAHRVYSPVGGHVPFSERGVVHITENSRRATFTPSMTVQRDLEEFSNALRGENAEGALYQIALQRGDNSNDWDISSVKTVSPWVPRFFLLAILTLFFPVPSNRI